MEYDFLKARFFGLGGALVLSYLESNDGKMDVGLLASQAKLDKLLLISRLQSMIDKNIIRGIGEPNSSGVYKKYEIHSKALEIQGEKRIRK